MKPLTKILLAVVILVAACSGPSESHAQFVNFSLNKTSTSTGVDTITGTLTYPASIALSATATMTVISGTAGKLVLFGSNAGNTYTRLDSTSISYSGSTAIKDYDFNHFTNSKLDKPDFLLYKFIWYQTGGSVSAAKGKGLVRTSGGH